MVTRKRTTPPAKTATKSAGKPVLTSPTPAAAKRAMANLPSAEDLDLRDRLKSGPRRAAGPPLAGDTPTRAAMDALRNEVLPEPTTPRKPKGGK